MSMRQVSVRRDDPGAWTLVSSGAEASIRWRPVVTVLVSSLMLATY